MTSSTINTNPNFGFSTCLRRTWAIAQEHWLALMLAAFIRDLLSIIAAGLTFSLFVDLKGWNLLVAFLAGILVWAGMQAGYLKFCLHIYRQGQVNWQNLFACSSTAFQLLFANILYWFVVTVGLILLVVPGLIVAAKFSLSGLALVDQKLDPLKSLGTSYRMIKGFTKYAVGLLLIYFVGCLGSYLSLAFQLLLTISLCVLYEHIREQVPNQ